MIMSRQILPVVTEDVEDLKSKVSRGAYIISKEEKQIDGILIACGSEVALALEAKKLLKEKGYDIRVVSMPCNKLFDEQSKEYQESIIPENHLPLQKTVYSVFIFCRICVRSPAGSG